MIARSTVSILRVAPLCLWCVMSACSGGGGPAPAAVTAPEISQDDTARDDTVQDDTAQDDTVQNTAPTIGGSSPLTVNVGGDYSFTPTADDADGDSLTFMIANQPSWASFDPATGTLSGTPGPADVGTYADIEIRVSDGAASAALSAFELTVVAVANGAVTLSWTPPTTNEDGSALTDLAGYKLYYGTRSGDYPNLIEVENPGISSYVIEGLAPATWYFVATALDDSGQESDWSNEVAKTVP